MAALNANKIQSRNLDPDFKNKLAIRGEISMDDLSEDVRATISNGKGDVNYTALSNTVEGLKNTKADKTTLDNYFNKTTDKLSKEQLDDKLQSTISNTENILTVAQATYRLKSEPITEKDISNDFLTRLTGVENKAAAAATQAQASADTVNTLTTQVNEVKETAKSMTDAISQISLLNTTVSSLDKNVGTNRSSCENLDNKIVQTNRDMDALRLKIDANTYSSTNKIPLDSIDDKVKSGLDDIKTTQDSIKVLQGVQGKLSEGKSGQIVSICDGSGTMKASDLITPCTIVHTDNDFENGKKAGKPIIFYPEAGKLSFSTDGKAKMRSPLNTIADNSDATLLQDETTPKDSNGKAVYSSFIKAKDMWIFQNHFFHDAETGEILFNNPYNDNLTTFMPGGIVSNLNTISGNTTKVQSTITDMQAAIANLQTRIAALETNK
jgi:uncharacterized coiled-coil DUF342 family protein